MQLLLLPCCCTAAAALLVLLWLSLPCSFRCRAAAAAALPRDRADLLPCYPAAVLACCLPAAPSAGLLLPRCPAAFLLTNCRRAWLVASVLTNRCSVLQSGCLHGWSCCSCSPAAALLPLPCWCCSGCSGCRCPASSAVVWRPLPCCLATVVTCCRAALLLLPCCLPADPSAGLLLPRCPAAFLLTYCRRAWLVASVLTNRCSVLKNGCLQGWSCSTCCPAAALLPLPCWCCSGCSGCRCPACRCRCRAAPRPC